MTNEYASIEQFREEPKSLLSDEWAVGVLFYKLLANGKHPFDVEGKSRQERIIIMEKTQQINFKDEFFSALPSEIKNIITRLLKIDQTKRMTIDQLISHPLMENTSK